MDHDDVPAAAGDRHLRYGADERAIEAGRPRRLRRCQAGRRREDFDLRPGAGDAGGLCTGPDCNHRRRRALQPLQHRAAPRIAIQAAGFGLCVFNTSVSADQTPLAILLQPPGNLRVQLMHDNNLPAAGVRVGVNSFQDPTGVSGALPAELRQQLSKVSDALGSALHRISAGCAGLH